MATKQPSLLDNAVNFVKTSLGNAASGVSRVIASAPSFVNNFQEDFNNFTHHQEQQKQNSQQDVFNLAQRLFSEPIVTTPLKVINPALSTAAPLVPLVTDFSKRVVQQGPIPAIDSVMKPVLGGTVKDFAQGFTSTPQEAAEDPRGALATTNLPYSFGNFIANDMVGANLFSGIAKTPEKFSLSKAAAGGLIGGGVTAGANYLSEKPQDLPGTLINVALGGYLAGSHGGDVPINELDSLTKEEGLQLKNAKIKGIKTPELKVPEVKVEPTVLEKTQELIKNDLIKNLEEKKVTQTAYDNTVKNGGVTISLKGDQPAQGFAYSPYKGIETIVEKKEFKPENINDFVLKNAEVLQQPGNHIGMWEQDGKIYMDVSQVGAPDAITLQKAQDAKQLAVFDLSNFKEVELGKMDGEVYNKTYEAANHPYLNGGEIARTDIVGDAGGVPEVSGGIEPSTIGGEPGTPLSGNIGDGSAPDPFSGRTPTQPEGLKTPIGQIPTEELQVRAKSKSRFKEAYVEELARRGLTGEEGVKERGHIETVRQNPNYRDTVREQVQGTYDVTTDEGRLSFGRDFVEKKFAEAEARALSDEPLTNELSGIYFGLQEKLQTMADAAEKAGNSEEARALDARTTAIENKMAEKLTPVAQVLQFAHLFSERTPMGMVRWAKNIYDQSNKLFNLSPVRLGKKILGKDFELHLSETQLKSIETRMREIGRMSDGVEKLKATQQLMRDITKDIPPSVLQYTDAYRYQNMLINPLTQFRNTYFNVANSVFLRPATLEMKGLNDTFIRMSGREAKGKLGDAPKYYVNMIRNLGKAREGFKNGWAGREPINKTETEVGFSSYNTATGKNLPWALTIASRGMEASDQFFTELIANSEYALNLEKGMSEDAAKKSAYDVATKYLYRKQLDPTNSTGQGLLGSNIDKLTNWIISGRKNVGPLGWFVPFVRVPMEVAKMSLEYFPGTGAINLIGNAEKSEQLAKIQVGAMAMGIGAIFAANGNTTWAAPKDEKQNKLFYDSGRKPYSFKMNIPGFGEKWVPFSYAGPLALSMMLPAAVKYYHDDAPKAGVESELAKISNVAFGLLQNFTASTPVSGLGGFVNMVEGAGDFTLPTQLGFTAGQLIPMNGLVTYMANLLDPIYRKSGGTFTGQIQKGIPFLSKNLEAYTDSEGNPSKRGLSNFLLPAALGTPNEDVEPFYGMRQNQLQSNAIINYNKKEMEAALKEGRKPNLKGINGKAISGSGFGEQLEKTIYPDDTDYSGYSDIVTKKMKRSRDFGYLRKLQEQADELGLDPSVLEEEFKRKKITKADLQYDDKTALTDDVQLDEISSMIEGLEGDELMSTLVSMRKVSEGTRKALLTDAMIGYLVRDGYISKSQGAALKRVQWDSKTGQFKLGAADGGGSSKSLSMSGVKPPKIETVSSKVTGPSSSGSGSSGGSGISFKTVNTKVPTQLKSSNASLKLKNITPNIRNKITSIRGLGGIS